MKNNVYLTPKEKKTLITAIDLLIENEQDTISHEKLVHKLMKVRK